MINLPNRCQRLISRAEWHTVRLKGASGESEGLRRYDMENLLWQSTVAIRSDPVGSRHLPGECGFGRMTTYGSVRGNLRRKAI